MDDGGSPRPGRDSDAEDALSDYSSCEGSEFERYCSANSAFGSASRCSEKSGSFTTRSENRSMRDKFWRSRWGFESPRANGSPKKSVLGDGMDPLPGIGTGSKPLLSSDENPSSSKGFCIQSTSVREERADLDENLGAGFNGFASDYNGKMPEEDANGLSGCECSEGEDSMLDYGTDDECRIHLHGLSNLHSSSKEIEARKGKEKENENENENENPLFINSCVAFGSNDWDEFMEENGGDAFAPMSLYQDQPVQQQPGPLEFEGNLSDPIMDHANGPLLDGMEQEDNVRSIQAPGCLVTVIDHEVLDGQQPHFEECCHEGDLSLKHDGLEIEVQPACSEEAACTDPDRASGRQVIGETEILEATLCDSMALQSYSALTAARQSKETGSQEFDRARFFMQTDENLSSVDVLEDPVLEEVNKLDTGDSCDEMVLEMEEILLDSGKPHGARSTQANQGYITQQSHDFRDGSSTASTSGADDAYPPVQHPPKIDWIEVVGAKQKKGDVSFGERLVGVKEYTIYKLRVWSGRDQWEVERRYREFYALYRQLKTLFTDHGLRLPYPWSNVEQESRNIFGNASPLVVSERSALIQNCLRSILNSRYPFGTPSSLICFLSPGKSMHNSGLLNALVPQSLQKLGEDEKSKLPNYETPPEDISIFGKTISLVVEIKPRKSMIQLLEAQQYTCAGCRRHLDAGNSLLLGIVQTLGWNKPRFCEYTGQLFCASCHTNDTAVLPARVLHLWDFSLYPVSQLAKAYLESIYHQPMLCVSAVNPFLFSKVPALLHVVGIRKKIGAMIPYVRCPFRMSIQRGLGLRRHLLESNDFFALQDLVDLSKGAFAALPIMLETISNKIFEHITQQCLECYDAGVPCAARQACDDPSSLIFPFQEAEATRCGSCGSTFHKPCFGKLMGCPCGMRTGATTEKGSQGASKEPNGVPHRSIQHQDPSSTSSFLSNILSKARPDKIWKPKNKSPVILMGSLPSTSL